MLILPFSLHPPSFFSILLLIDRCSWTLVKLLGQWENFNTEILSWEIAKTLLHYTTTIVNLLFFKEDLILFLIRHQYYYMRNKWSIKIFTKRRNILVCFRWKDRYQSLSCTLFPETQIFISQITLPKTTNLKSTFQGQASFSQMGDFQQFSVG